MRGEAPNLEDALEAWDGAAGRALPEAALGWWQLFDGRGVAELAEEPLGRRNRALWTLRRRFFGDRLAVITRCSPCGERTELELELDALLQIPSGSPGWSAWRGPEGAPELELRPVNTVDLLAAMEVGRPELVLERCARGLAPLPAALWPEVGAALESLDPAASYAMRVTCAACGVEARHECDPADIVGRELDEWARERLAEIQRLARAHGWSQREIIDLSPRRRRLYLELLEGS